MNEFLLSQILASIAFIFGIISFQFKERHHVLRCWFISALSNSIHFIILQNHTAATLVFITSIRFLTASYTNDRRLMWLFLTFTITGFIITYENIINIMPLISATIGTFASFQKGDKNLRILLIFSTTLWVAHNIIVGSPVAAIMEAAFVTSNIIGLYRFYIVK